MRCLRLTLAGAVVMVCTSVLGLFLGCTSEAAGAAPGTLQFKAHGGELVAKGFVGSKLTKDGWSLSFTHVFVTLADITAHRQKPVAAAGDQGEKSVLPAVHQAGPYTIDLTTSGSAGLPVGKPVTAPAGHYSAVSWRLAPAESGPAAGYSLFLIGRAEKGSRWHYFSFGSKDRLAYRCEEPADTSTDRRVFLAPGDRTKLDITFHLDRLFGRADQDAATPLNQEAKGFGPLANVIKLFEHVQQEVVGFHPYASKPIPFSFPLDGIQLVQFGGAPCRVVE